MQKNIAKQPKSNFVNEEEHKGLEPGPSGTGSKTTLKLNLSLESDSPYRSTAVMSANTRGGYGKIEFDGTQPMSFLQPKHASNTNHETIFDMPLPVFSKGSSNQKGKKKKKKSTWFFDCSAKMRNMFFFFIYLKKLKKIDMDLCGMKPCEVFVDCATLEPLDNEIELFVPGLVREEKREEDETKEEGLSQSLKVSESCCIVSNGIKECMQLVPLSLAQVSDDVDLQFQSSEASSATGKHIPQIKGCVMIQHKPVGFAVHFYECPDNGSATVIEFQRRSGDGFVFQVKKKSVMIKHPFYLFM
ncbi:hypothetical protein RFI_34820 [Reticulomyxa filosa]|uniref:Uncharacterized protein n=1 Tax=Reticulomyxa filosa TaxID=46433 RepID=X6LMJ5_RETFI|nr:hypothetical protein RFI_34820 [Reticulomyxa filosa]|eukprot:ETO02601.1 hypothetical protein RFI_34820 [Reticulomyxa filosa]